MFVLFGFFTWNNLAKRYLCLLLCSSSQVEKRDCHWKRILWIVKNVSCIFQDFCQILYVYYVVFRNLRFVIAPVLDRWLLVFQSFGQHGRELITTELALRILSILSEEEFLPNIGRESFNHTLDRLVIKVWPLFLLHSISEFFDEFHATME